MSLTTVDVGNTAIGIGRWDGDDVRLERHADPREAASVLSGPLAIVSVSPTRLQMLLAALRDGAPRVLSGVPCAVRDERLGRTAGADRLAAVVALLPGPGLVLDAGTALTVDVLDARGVHVGGFIAPGPGLLAQSLAHGTAALPHVPPRVVALEPGLDTVAAIEGGVWGLAVGGADRLVTAARAWLPDDPSPTLVATGGWGEAWCAATSHRGFVFDPALVHRGIRRWSALT